MFGCNFIAWLDFLIVSFVFLLVGLVFFLKLFFCFVEVTCALYFVFLLSQLLLDCFCVTSLLLLALSQRQRSAFPREICNMKFLSSSACCASYVCMLRMCVSFKVAGVPT